LHVIRNAVIKGGMLEKKQQNDPECNDGIRNQSLKQQLHWEKKEIIYEALRQTIGLRVIKGTVRFSVRN
jgi:hypothetical protein